MFKNINIKQAFNKFIFRDINILILLFFELLSYLSLLFTNDHTKGLINFYYLYRIFFLYFIWIFINYCTNNYSINNKLKDFKLQIFRFSFSIIIFYISIYSINIITKTNAFNSQIFSINIIISFILCFIFRIYYFHNAEINKKGLFLVDVKNKNNRLIKLIKSSGRIFKFVDIDELNNKIIDKKKFDIIFFDEKKSKKKYKIICDLKRKGHSVFSSLGWIEKNLYRYPSELVNSNRYTKKILNKREFELFQKTFFEKILSCIILVLSAPIVVIACTLIYLEDKGPIFYSQIRSGHLKRKIRVYKLRTMKINAEQDGPQWSKKDDPRITKIGKILRKTRIDEIPQLLQVIKGDLSLIGPRPERPEIDKMLASKIVKYNKRYLLKPGLTGWAQVNYRYGSTIEDAQNKLDYDLYYIKNFSIWLEINIFIKTIKIILNSKGSIPKT